MLTNRISLLLSVFILLFAHLSNDRYIYAEDKRPSGWAAGITLTFDNDAFSGQDDHYTNGLQLAISSQAHHDHRQGPFGGIGHWLNALPGQRRTGTTRFSTLSVSQRIFTPEDISTTERIDNDMPYSGHLTLGASVSAQDDRRLDAWSLQLGVIGSLSLAADTQKLVHRTIGADRPRGWRNQLPNEAVVNVAYETRRRAWQAQRGNWGADAILSAGGMVGNLISQVHAGVAFRFGRHLPTNFATPAPYLGEGLIGRRTETISTVHSSYGYVMFDVAAIPYAAFWDGTLFRSSTSIDRDYHLARAHIGFHQDLGPVGVDLIYIAQNIPWDAPHGQSVESYGSLQFNFRM